MEVHKGLRQDDVIIDVYSDSEPQTEIKLVIKGNNLYIDTRGTLNVDDKTNVQLVDEHYKGLDETFFEDNNFDYTAYLPD